MLIPQGMAYAILAGMPPMFGLYSSIFSLLLYAPFSTSPQLAVGPSAMMSLLSSAAIAPLAGGSCEGGLSLEDPLCARYVDLSLKLAFLVGCASLLLGLLKGGYLVNFLSHPVLKGFTMAAAIIIGSGQINKVLGFKIERHEYVYDTWIDLVEGIAEGKTHLLTFLLFIENMALFYGLKYMRTWLRTHPAVKSRKALLQVVNAFPNALVVVAVNIAVVGGFRLDESGVGIVGKIQSGIPAPTNILNASFGSDVGALLPSALVMCIVGFMESISVAKAMALRYGTVIDSDQELVGLGVANIGASFFNSFTTTGGFSRTMVNGDAGAKTPLAGMLSAGILAIVVVFLTGLFEFLPSVTLGSMIIFAVTKLVEFTTPRMLWAVDKGDFVVYAVSFVATLILGIELGIAVGAAISLARVVKEAAIPHVAVLGKMPTGTWRNVKRFPDEAQTAKGLRVLRFDSPIFFANAAFFKDLILRTCRPGGEADGGCVPRAVVIDCSAVASMDSSAIHTLEGLPDELRKQAKQARAARLKTLRRRLTACAPQETLDEVRSLTTPRSASVDEFRPGMATDTPCTDEDIAADDADALTARIRHVVSTPPRIPVLFLACVRGPVRDVIRRNDHFEDCEEARAAFVKGNVWRCEYPCRCVAPHRLLFVGCRSVPGMPGRQDAAPAAPGEKSDAGGGIELAGASALAQEPRGGPDAGKDASRGGELDEGVTGNATTTKYPLLQLVLQDQDIGDAVARVKNILRDADDAARMAMAEAGDALTEAAAVVGARDPPAGPAAERGATP